MLYHEKSGNPLSNQDEFRWSFVKSTGLFIFGVYLARELRGVDLIGSGA
jgi:hypothetical protein